jgi:hypothetical protein
MSNVELLDREAIGESFELPDGACITGYYVSRHDGKRYPFGSAPKGFWARDEFGWAMWHTAERRDEVIAA